MSPEKWETRDRQVLKNPPTSFERSPERSPNYNEDEVSYTKVHNVIGVSGRLEPEPVEQVNNDPKGRTDVPRWVHTKYHSDKQVESWISVRYDIYSTN